MLTEVHVYGRDCEITLKAYISDKKLTLLTKGEHKGQGLKTQNAIVSSQHSIIMWLLEKQIGLQSYFSLKSRKNYHGVMYKLQDF